MATTPKQPQDHKTKGEAAEPVKPAGWDLLKPFDQVPAWDQADLMAIMQPLMADMQSEQTQGDGPGDKQIDMASFDFRLFGELARKLQDFAVHKDAYLKFASGQGALERTIDLATWYANQLGE